MESKIKHPVKDCQAMTYWADAIDPQYHREKYCMESCLRKCERGVDYKKILEEG